MWYKLNSVLEMSHFYDYFQNMHPCVGIKVWGLVSRCYKIRLLDTKTSFTSNVDDINFVAEIWALQQLVI